MSQRTRCLLVSVLSSLSLFFTQALVAQSAGLEARWFFRGDIPATVRSWFERGALGGVIPDEDVDRRADVYLVLDQNAAIGLKLRGGDLELKSRETTRKISLGNVAGQAETWRKWSWKYDAASRDVVDLAFNKSDLKGTRHEVQKERRQHKFQIKNNRVVPAASKSRVDRGCAAEITTLHVEKEAWWSFAVETLGTTSLSDLKRCAKSILRDAPFSGRAEDSYAYPLWLLKLQKNSSKTN
jgi:hypothetical protein